MNSNRKTCVHTELKNSVYQGIGEAKRNHSYFTKAVSQLSFIVYFYLFIWSGYYVISYESRSSDHILFTEV